MDRDSVASSNIESVGYDEKTETLEVEFLSGAVYQYYGVPRNIHEEFIKAQSKGQFLILTLRIHIRTPALDNAISELGFLSSIMIIKIL